jgi:hypothetical protein
MKQVILLLTRFYKFYVIRFSTVSIHKQMESQEPIKQVQPTIATPGLVYFCYGCEKDIPNIENDLLVTTIALIYYVSERYFTFRYVFPRECTMSNDYFNLTSVQTYCPQCTFCGGSFVEEKANSFEHAQPVRPETGARSKIR